MKDINHQIKLAGENSLTENIVLLGDFNNVKNNDLDIVIDWSQRRLALQLISCLFTHHQAF